MVIVIVGFWALAGLTVFLLAMRRPRASGAPRAREPLAETRTGRRLFALGIAMFVAVGLAVPTLVLAFNGEHKAGIATGGIHLNAEQQRGRHLFSEACSVCHTLATA